MPSLVQLRPTGRPDPFAAIAPRLLSALDAELARCPPRPPGITACVAWLQESPEHLGARQMAVRALENLRTALFTAPGREAEMALLWREALASACYARVVAAQMNFDGPLLTGAGLLHRTGEVAALRALARAEGAVGQRLVGPVMQQIMEAHDDELVSRVTRSWGLPGELRLTILRWRDEQENLNRPLCVTLLLMVQALATQLVHAATCTPGLVEAAQQSLGLPASLVDAGRTMTRGITSLLDQLAPLPA
ncbi:MAG TPA: HDOD domain-containing protein [Steroidobacteraceae bacterium]|nr:HDOD domain-containing protein [Steroidobacteraceae bacterium]